MKENIKGPKAKLKAYSAIPKWFLSLSLSDTLSVCVLVMLRLSDEATCNKSDQTLFLTSLSSQEIQDWISNHQQNIPKLI